MPLALVDAELNVALKTQAPEGSLLSGFLARTLKGAHTLLWKCVNAYREVDFVARGHEPRTDLLVCDDSLAIRPSKGPLPIG